MDSKAFVAGLVDEMQHLFSRLGAHEALESEADGAMDVATLLKLALKSELEASELAGFWMPTTVELEAKLVFAQQCGDEMKHYRLIAQRLAEMGETLAAFNPLAAGYSPLYQYLRGLKTTVERLSAGLFTTEAIAEVRNLQFIAFCRSVGDEATAALYERVIHPEEVHHHREGRRLLEAMCTTPESQELAAAAMRNTLAIADELRSLSERATGLHNLPLS
jgi:1,2-phenylacetyl-CoA epoxidase catalytic subunit